MYDSHTHTVNSPDGIQTIDELCLRAIEMGVKGVAVTEHTHLSPVYLHYFPDFKPIPAIRQGIKDVLYGQEKYGDKLLLTCGLEVDEYLDDPKGNDELISLYDFDVLLGSIHYLKEGKWDLQYSKVVYDDTVSDQELKDYLKAYFEAIALMAERTDIDVLAHLTCPMRYINGRHGRRLDISEFTPIIKDILKTIISRKIALEINTTGLLRCEFGGCLCPDNNLITLYKELGGTLITLGSDAHRTQGIAQAFKETKDILKNLGFSEYHFYKNRKPMKITID